MSNVTVITPSTPAKSHFAMTYSSRGVHGFTATAGTLPMATGMSKETLVALLSEFRDQILHQVSDEVSRIESMITEVLEQR